MTTFAVEPYRINAFAVGEEYLFRRYFERDDLFRQLAEYYDRDAYRFAVPEAEFEGVSELLANEGFEPIAVDDLEPFCVVKERYTKHADILRDSVAHWQRRGYNFFLLPDVSAVETAVEAGAIPSAEIDLALGL